MMNPPRIRIWGPPNKPNKIPKPITPKSTRVIHKVCQISLVRSSKCSPDRGRTLLTGWKCRVHKKHHLFGIILGCCTEKANFCFQMPSFRVKKLKLTKRRKLSKILLFMDITELCQGPQVSGTTKFHSPGIGELKNGQESRESGYPGFPWHPIFRDTLFWSQKWN